MKRFALFALFCGIAALGFAAPASEATIRELLKVSDAQNLVDKIIPQVNQMMDGAMHQAIGDRQLTADQEKAIATMKTKMMGIMKDELAWDKLEPMYLSVYQQSLTEEEAQGILAFYKTPAGQAMIKKLPVIMQNTMQALQKRMGPMMEKIQGAVQETASEINEPPAK